MYKHIVLVGVGVVAAWSITARAEGPLGPAKGDRDALTDRAFQHLDADGDGKVDPTEFRQQIPQLVERIRGRFQQGRRGRGVGAGKGFSPGQGPGEGKGLARGRGFGAGKGFGLWQGHRGGRGFGRGRGHRAFCGMFGPCGPRGGKGFGRHGCPRMGMFGRMGPGRDGPGGEGLMALLRPLERMIDAKVEQAVRRAMGHPRQDAPEGRFGHGRRGGSWRGKGMGAGPGRCDLPALDRPGASLGDRKGPRGDHKPMLDKQRGQRSPRSPEARRPGRRGQGPLPRVQALIDAFDANNDGKIEAAEVTRVVETLKRLDRNGDKVLDANDLKGAPPVAGKERMTKPGPPARKGKPRRRAEGEPSPPR